MAEGALTLRNAATSGQKVDRPGRRRLRAFTKHRFAMVGLFVILLMIVVAVLAPVIATHDPNRVDLLAAAQSPSRDHLLGTDEIGRDVFSRVVYGARVSLSVGLV